MFFILRIPSDFQICRQPCWNYMGILTEERSHGGQESMKTAWSPTTNLPQQCALEGNLECTVDRTLIVHAIQQDILKCWQALVLCIPEFSGNGGSVVDVEGFLARQTKRKQSPEHRNEHHCPALFMESHSVGDHHHTM